MLSRLFLGISLVGAEWVLYLLLILSVLSVSVIIERARFYAGAATGLREFRQRLREAILQGKWEEAHRLAQERAQSRKDGQPDLESEMALTLLSQRSANLGTEVLEQLAQDAVIRGRLAWDRSLAILATVGSNAPFVGLFGTVLGIIKAFNDLSQQQATQGVQTVTSGISEALVATAFGILVAIPAVVAFNLFQRRVRTALAEAESLKSFLIGRLAK